MPKKKSKYIGGNCYQGAFDYVMSHDGWTLVHGIAVVTAGPNKGKKFGHAWCERGEIVYDAASDMEVPKIIYYAIGQVGYTHPYTKEQAREEVLQSMTYGYWDSKLATALHS